MSTINQPRKGGRPVDPKKGYWLYRDLVDLIAENKRLGKHSGLRILLTDPGEVEGLTSNLDDFRVIDSYKSRPVLREDGDGLFRQYLREVGDKPGAVLINSQRGVPYNDRTLIEGVDRSLDGLENVVDRNTGGSAIIFVSNYMNGLGFYVSEERDSLIVAKNARVVTTTEDIQTAYGLRQGEVLGEDQFLERLLKPEYSHRAELPAIPNGFDEMDFSGYKRVPSRLKSKAYHEVFEFAKRNKGEKSLLLLLGDKELIPILTTPLNGDILEDYFDGNDIGIYSPGIGGVLDEMGGHDGAIAFGLDGKPIRDKDGKLIFSKLHVNRVRSDGDYYKVQGEGLRPWVASCASQYGGVTAICVGENGIVRAFQGGKLWESYDINSFVDRIVEPQLTKLDTRLSSFPLNGYVKTPAYVGVGGTYR